MMADIEAYDLVMAELASGEDEIIPWDIIERRVAGESPLKIWREYRGLTQAELAEKTGISRSMIAAMEAGHKQGSVSSLKKLAKLLKVDLEQIA